MSTTVPFLRPREDDPAESGGEPPRVSAIRANRRLVLGVVVALLVGALVAWLVAFSPVLGVKRVSVRGLQTLTASKVRSVAAVKHGTPLVRLDTAAITTRVQSIPEVASARVSTSYPNTVVITVVERHAVGYLSDGGRFVLVDKTGDQYRTVSAQPHNLPLFALPTGATAKATGQAVAEVAASLTPALRAKVASIQAFDPTAITLLLSDQRVVRWGSSERSDDKARVLPTLLAQPGTRFDVSNPDLVVAH
jgi:cell division protein FtsQ